MTNHIVILGGGTAGTIAANRLRHEHAEAVGCGKMKITVVDEDDRHIYQPGLLFLPFGLSEPADLVRSRRAQLHPGITLMRGRIDRVDIDAGAVVLETGRPILYDVLIVASGSRIAPEETEGMTGAGWRERVFDFYTLEGALALREALSRFDGGKLVINVVDQPIKCPVAPLEFAFLADWYFVKRGMRDRVEIAYVTPLDGAFTKPVAAKTLAHLLEDKHIALKTEFNTGRVDGTSGTLYSWDDQEIPFDLLVTVPLHAGAEFVRRSPGLGDDLGFVFTDPHTLQAKAAPNIFAIGDATNVPASKAGSVAHFEADVLVRNVGRLLLGAPLDAAFDGHSNCFIETGFDRALLIDFNYDVEPLPGEFPIPGIGPMRLMRESRLNHLAKKAFKWVYWNLLLPGRHIPGIPARMRKAGKRSPAAAAADN